MTSPASRFVIRKHDKLPGGVIPKALGPEEMLLLNSIATNAIRNEPYPGHIHPGYGDLRPQRLYPSIPDEIQDHCLLLAETFDRPLKIVDPAYLIFYPPETLMHPHVDKHSQGDHWRVGLVIKQRCEGGSLILGSQKVELKEGDAYVFRADSTEHAITKVTRGYRLIMTMGFIRSEDAT